MKIADEFLDTFDTGVWVLGPGVDFNPVAGRKDGVFDDFRKTDEAFDGVLNLSLGEGQTFTDFYGRRLVIHPNEYEIRVGHGYTTCRK